MPRKATQTYTVSAEEVKQILKDHFKVDDISFKISMESQKGDWLDELPLSPVFKGIFCTKEIEV